MDDSERILNSAFGGNSKPHRLTQDNIEETAPLQETTRRYSVVYSPTIEIVYRIYTQDNERVIEEVVRFHRFCLDPFPSMPGERLIDMLRREQGIAKQDIQGFPENHELHKFGWDIPKWWFLVVYNIFPFWRAQWRYPLTPQ